MFNLAASAVLQKGLREFQVLETIFFISVSVLIQFVIHFIPPVNGLPMGQILLPIFYAPLIALIFFRLHVALTAAILAPMLNYLITGAPRPEILALLTIEVTVFVILAYFLLRNKKTELISAFAAVIFAKVFSIIIMPLFMDASGSFLQSLVIAVPGILIISVLNMVMLRYKSN